MTIQPIDINNLTKGIGPNVSPEAFTNDKRKIFLFGSPSYTNIGDQAIAYSIEQFITSRFPYYEYIEIMDYATDEGIEFVKKIIHEDDIVMFTGGGNLGSLYLDIEEDRRKVFAAFKDYKSISMPQSVFFENNEHGEQEKKKTQDAYHQNKNLTIAARENQTLDIVRQTFDSNVIYTPDMVMSLDYVPRQKEREGVMFFLRADKEKVMEEDFVAELMEWTKKYGSVDRADTVLDEKVVPTIDYADREKHFLEMLDLISSKKLIVTDRLHAMIFSILTKTPCLVFGNSYGKAKHSYQDWLSSIRFVEYTDSKDVELLEQLADKLMQEEPNEVDLRKDYQPLVDFFRS
ncbi:Exopolysaccharide biosynthesis protein EpsI, predicted pyruvyl transferase [Terribacillus aidingensis]|uniref:Exopolysaccharide biosynthesis protein EpsI, predicted pyruvyl transferase n=1 Tax=Terribacillus aidingensis TaxID=586416 RepID=A0A285N1N5_9BACI|nr:polysaccharide pyruvyl transferase family protein [Terribacillus aidingensis]SNZ03384.1 Exopolysaccharide biosynthesis protein EpsI, predicted pyruvyl transferase [Terribacillus aidingensis]